MDNGKISTSASASKLAEVFPSILTAEGKKSPEPVKPPNPSEKIQSTEDLAEKLDENLKIEECCRNTCISTTEENKNAKEEAKVEKKVTNLVDFDRES